MKSKFELNGKTEYELESCTSSNNFDSNDWKLITSNGHLAYWNENNILIKIID